MAMQQTVTFRSRGLSLRQACANRSAQREPRRWMCSASPRGRYQNGDVDQREPRRHQRYSFVFQHLRDEPHILRTILRAAVQS